jgi:hypothetical protein
MKFLPYLSLAACIAGFILLNSCSAFQSGTPITTSVFYRSGDSKAGISITGTPAIHATK